MQKGEKEAVRCSSWDYGSFTRVHRGQVLSSSLAFCSHAFTGQHFCVSGHRSYFKRKQPACFPAQAGLAKLSPSNHSLGIYFCPPDFLRHFLGLLVCFLLGVMEQD